MLGCNQTFIIIIGSHEYFSSRTQALHQLLHVAAALSHTRVCSDFFLQKMWESQNVARNTLRPKHDSPSKFDQNRSARLGAVGQKQMHFPILQLTFSFTKCGNVGLQRKFYYNYRAPRIFLVLYPGSKCQLPGVAVALKRSRLCSKFFL